MSVNVHHGDSRHIISFMASDSIDACVCDPPYALVSIAKRFGKDGAAPAKSGKTGAYARASRGFMGKVWDTGDTAFDPTFWAEVLRVLKPGAHLVAFGGTRTYHRLACAVEDAGFEVRDQLAWLYGSGFPKSHNQPGGWGTALKPALEPIILARKPLIGTVAANIEAHGTGALNIDGCRIATDESLNGGAYADGGGRSPLVGDERQGAAAGMFQPGKTAGSPFRAPPGRWPANVIHDGSDEVVGAFPDSAGQQGDITGREASALAKNVYGSGLLRQPVTARGDSGSAARFFYSAKADAEDRLGSNHPTVKPVDLMRWLCRLVTPPGGTVLDPFAGTGSTGIAAMAEGFDCILIEREAEYVADINRRLAWARGEGRLTAQEIGKRKPVANAGPLFAETAA